MPEINGRTLMMAIQAVDSMIHELVEQLDADGRADDGELELLLLSYGKAASELQRGYEEACRSASNLPPYATLVRASMSRPARQ